MYLRHALSEEQTIPEIMLSAQNSRAKKCYFTIERHPDGGLVATVATHRASPLVQAAHNAPPSDLTFIAAGRMDPPQPGENPPHITLRLGSKEAKQQHGFDGPSSLEERRALLQQLRTRLAAVLNVMESPLIVEMSEEPVPEPSMMEEWKNLWEDTLAATTVLTRTYCHLCLRTLEYRMGLPTPMPERAPKVSPSRIRRTAPAC